MVGGVIGQTNVPVYSSNHAVFISASVLETTTIDKIVGDLPTNSIVTIVGGGITNVCLGELLTNSVFKVVENENRKAKS